MKKFNVNYLYIIATILIITIFISLLAVTINVSGSSILPPIPLFPETPDVVSAGAVAGPVTQQVPSVIQQVPSVVQQGPPSNIVAPISVKTMRPMGGVAGPPMKQFAPVGTVGPVDEMNLPTKVNPILTQAPRRQSGPPVMPSVRLPTSMSIPTESGPREVPVADIGGGGLTQGLVTSGP